MLGLAHLQIGGAGNRRARLDQVHRIKLLCAVFALIATCFIVSTIGAGAFDIPIWQIAPIRMREDLLLHNFFDQTGVGQFSGKMLCEFVVLRRRRPPEVVE